MKAAHNETINLNSLNLVREELIATIEQATVRLEGFIDAQKDTKMLQSCVDLLEQVSGILDLVQLHGASELAKEVLDSANGIMVGDLPPLEEGLSVLTRSFLTLSRYFEYVLQCQKALPTLLIPYINDIRVVYHRALMHESYFFEVDVARLKTVEDQRVINSDDTLDGALDEKFTDAIGRLRHMYQVGLLGIFKQVGIKPSIGLMHRAVARIANLSAGYKTETFWWVAAIALSLFEKADLEATRERKHNFGHLDRQIKRLHSNGLSQFDQLPPAELLQDLVYYIALSGVDDDSTKAVQSLYGYQPLSYNDGDRRHEQRALTGPNANTVHSLVSTLQEELKAVKEIVEKSSNSDTLLVQSYKEIVDKITKIKDILDLVGLETGSLTMEQQLVKIKQWQESDQSNDSAQLASQLSELADALLYVEMMLNDLKKLNFSGEKLNGLDSLSREEMIVSTQLAEAQLIVLEEIEAGLSMVKRALSTFSDSGFDSSHITDVPATLDSLHGGMILLERARAAAIVASCARFIEKSLLATKQPAALAHMMDTFADALTGLEYYMEYLKVDPNLDDDILVIAEDSLAALGHSVEHGDAKEPPIKS